MGGAAAPTTSSHRQERHDAALPDLKSANATAAGTWLLPRMKATTPSVFSAPAPHIAATSARVQRRSLRETASRSGERTRN